MRRTAFILALVATAALAGCAKRTKPPGTAGVCFHVVPQTDGQLKYNKLTQAESFEKCAAALEGMRVRFLRMGGSQRQLVGAYQSNFIFLDANGVSTSTSLEGPRYTAFVRAGGMLVVPGAMPQQPAR